MNNAFWGVLGESERSDVAERLSGGEVGIYFLALRASASSLIAFSN